MDSMFAHGEIWIWIRICISCLVCSSSSFYSGNSHIWSICMLPHIERFAFNMMKDLRLFLFDKLTCRLRSPVWCSGWKSLYVKILHAPSHDTVRSTLPDSRFSSANWRGQLPRFGFQCFWGVCSTLPDFLIFVYNLKDAAITNLFSVFFGASAVLCLIF